MSVFHFSARSAMHTNAIDLALFNLHPERENHEFDHPQISRASSGICAAISQENMTFDTDYHTIDTLLMKITQKKLLMH